MISSPLATVIVGALTLLGSIFAASATATSKVNVIEEREQNHYQEVKELILQDRIDRKEENRALTEKIDQLIKMK